MNVNNLSQDFVTKDILKGLFITFGTPFGDITDAQLMKDKKGNFHGFGTVSFESTSIAHKACEALNGHYLGSGQRLTVWKDQYRYVLLVSLSLRPFNYILDFSAELCIIVTSVTIKQVTKLLLTWGVSTECVRLVPKSIS